MLKKIQQTLSKYNKKVWVMYNVENHDKYFCKFFSRNLSTQSICIISTDDIYILVSSLDAQNVTKLKYNKEKIHILIYENSAKLHEYIEDVIANLKFPNEICLSYSTMSDKSTDILTHGDFVMLTTLLKAPYQKYSKKVKFSSAEKIIYDLVAEKTIKQLERLKFIANITSEILDTTFEKLRVGVTEIQIVNLTTNITNEIMKKYIGKNNIQSYGMAWENCPIVLTGENFLKGGHALPSSKKLNRGDTVYFDFGIEVTFDDKETLYSDMQRMGYVLKQNETSAPKDVQKVFDTLVEAIEDGIDELKPGKKGYEIDTIVRNKITKAGYPDYNHATGHPVGLKVHDIGAIITLKNSKRARLELVENGVYTLEPRVSISNGGSIEEMIQVTKFGGLPLCNTQKKLYLIKE